VTTPSSDKVTSGAVPALPHITSWYAHPEPNLIFTFTYIAEHYVLYQVSYTDMCMFMLTLEVVFDSNAHSFSYISSAGFVSPVVVKLEYQLLKTKDVACM